MSVIGTILRFVLERTSRNLTYETAIERLQASAQTVADRMGNASDTPQNRAQAGHIIGIERWGQRRLRVALGEALVLDEYDSYRPNGTVTLPVLRDAFVATRKETIALAQQLQTTGVPIDMKVFHNDIQDFTLRGWFGYLDGHATRESTRLKH